MCLQCLLSNTCTSLLSIDHLQTCLTALCLSHILRLGAMMNGNGHFVARSTGTTTIFQEVASLPDLFLLELMARHGIRLMLKI